MKTHKLEWYIPENNSYIYDKEVIQLLTPRINESIDTLTSIQELIKSTMKDIDSLPLTSKYLEYEELLSQIQIELECHFNRQ